MDAGRPNPMQPSPPEETSVRGFLKLVVLGYPHLVLADVGDDNVLAPGAVPKLLDNELRLQAAIATVAQRVFGFKDLDACEPFGTVDFFKKRQERL